MIGYMKKRVFCLALIITILFSTNIFASPYDNDFNKTNVNDDEITIMSEECPSCYNGVLLSVKTIYTAWVRLESYRLCPTHGGTCIQWLYTRDKITTYKCNSCGYGTKLYK